VSVGLISVVLPVYNQAVHIGPMLAEYVTALKELNAAFELLPVINGPRRDDSLEICQALSRDEPRIRTLCIEAGGWGRAVQTGLKEAGGDLLCYTNSARTAPADLRLLLRYGLSHPENVIKANRRLRDNFARRFGSVLYNFECRSLFDLPYWDINGTPKVFPRKLERLLTLKSYDDLVDLEFAVVCRREGYPVLEVPLVNTGRHGGVSTTSVASAYRMYAGAYRLWKTNRGE
jgi:glycosyltransferase involved in cell wall biosynthesis